MKKKTKLFIYVCVCVCVCVSEREKEIFISLPQAEGNHGMDVAVGVSGGLHSSNKRCASIVDGSVVVRVTDTTLLNWQRNKRLL